VAPAERGGMPRLVPALISATEDAALLLHGAAGVRAGRAYLFLAKSGGGKSTLASLCDESGIPVLGDEMAMVLEKRSAFFLRPLPRQSLAVPASLPTGEATRIRGIFFLAKDASPRVEPVPPLSSIARCLREDLLFEFRKLTPQQRQKVLSRCGRLFRRVPTYVLHFAKDNRFWDVIDELERCQAPAAS